MYCIKLCRSEELQHVLKLSELWKKENITIGYENVKHTIEGLAARLNDYFYVAVIDDEVVGYVFGEIRNGSAGPVIPQNENYLEIFEIYIHPNYRNQGVGRALLSTIHKQAESNGITRFLVGSSNRRWKETADFYEELGYQMWYIQMFK